MHPILANARRAGAYGAAWLLVGGLLTVSLAQQGVGVFEALLFVVPTFLFYGFVCLSAWYVCRAVPVAPGRLAAIASASLASAICAGLLWLSLAELWRFILRSTLLPGGTAAVAAQEPFLFSVAVILFLLVLSVHHVALAYDAARDAERQQFELQVLTRDAELRALRTQLNPHFLYNSLNSISALTTTQPEGARRMCILLGDFLRNTLRLGALDRITLADELTLIDAFIAIEQIRFGSRLTVERQVDEAALNAQVPPLLLQPLVENAIVHGIAGLIDGGTVQVKVARHDGRVLVRIENPRDPDVAPRRRGGVGLENVRRRLLAMFADRARVDAGAGPTTFHVELNLPFVEGDAHAA